MSRLLEPAIARGAMLTVMVAFMASLPARGETTTESPPPSFDLAATPPHAPPAEANDGRLFDKGTWSLELHASSYDDFDGGNVDLLYGTAGVGYYFADRTALVLQLAGYDLTQHGRDAGAGGSFDALLRGHVLLVEPFSVFLDAGAGVFLGDRRFPAGGTNTSFTLQAGVGATYRLTDGMHLMGGARWFHISNARRRGRDRNPHTDGTSLYFGVMFTW